MRWGALSSKAKWALVMMLVAIIPGVAGIVIGKAVFGETAPPFVYVMSAIWLILFFVGMARLRAGLIAGIVWAVMSLFAPLIIVLQGIRNPVALALGMPCLFVILGSSRKEEGSGSCVRILRVLLI